MVSCVEYQYQVKAGNEAGSTTSRWSVGRTLPGGTHCSIVYQSIINPFIAHRFMSVSFTVSVYTTLHRHH